MRYMTPFLTDSFFTKPQQCNVSKIKSKFISHHPSHSSIKSYKRQSDGTCEDQILHFIEDCLGCQYISIPLIRGCIVYALTLATAFAISFCRHTCDRKQWKRSCLADRSFWVRNKIAPGTSLWYKFIDKCHFLMT